MKSFLLIFIISVSQLSLLTAQEQKHSLGTTLTSFLENHKTVYLNYEYFYTEELPSKSVSASLGLIVSEKENFPFFSNRLPLDHQKLNFKFKLEKKKYRQHSNNVWRYRGFALGYKRINYGQNNDIIVDWELEETKLSKPNYYQSLIYTPIIEEGLRQQSIQEQYEIQYIYGLTFKLINRLTLEGFCQVGLGINQFKVLEGQREVVHPFDLNVIEENIFQLFSNYSDSSYPFLDIDLGFKLAYLL